MRGKLGDGVKGKLRVAREEWKGGEGFSLSLRAVCFKLNSSCREKLAGVNSTRRKHSSFFEEEASARTWG